jgi:nucleotide-binding universal stress UspA family protein
VILAPIDLGPSSRRVLYHAAGFARLLGEPLKVLHVTPDVSPDAYQRVSDFCRRHLPYEVDLDDDGLVLRSGRVSDAIQREARRQKTVVVMGARGHGGIARIILGSTSEAVLRGATTPVLLVPPADLDIINLSDRAVLTCGPVLAAVDLDDDCRRQLELASQLSWLAGRPLVLFTVARRNLTEHDASAQLRERGRGLIPVKPNSLIVRRGNVVQEIARCAIAEGAGLVVMGLRSTPRCQPGGIASGVLKTRRAFVLAVPGC